MHYYVYSSSNNNNSNNTNNKMVLPLGALDQKWLDAFLEYKRMYILEVTRLLKDC